MICHELISPGVWHALTSPPFFRYCHGPCSAGPNACHDIRPLHVSWHHCDYAVSQHTDKVEVCYSADAAPATVALRVQPLSINSSGSSSRRHQLPLTCQAAAGEVGPSKRGKRPGKQGQGQPQQQQQQQHASSEEWSLMDPDSEDLDDEEENFLVRQSC